MKKFLGAWALFLACNAAFAQKYEFQTVKDIACTPVISQGQTGTCWSFSTISFLESEILRKTGKPIDLSEMYNVRQTYAKKMYNYIMRQGKAQFSEGGLNHDVILVAKENGLMPLSAYSGLGKDQVKHNHKALAAELEALAKKYAEEKKPNAKEWQAALEETLNKHLQPAATEFTYDGKKFNAKSFLEYTKLNLNDYVTITSFSHVPFYDKFVLSIPDNFSNEAFYNLPLDEFIANIDAALEKGYTLGLDADVSEPTFSGKYGIAVLPEKIDEKKTFLTEIQPETSVTQELRQQWFEDFTTQDDHLMHIVGKVKDQKGNVYYKVKNSWGTDNLGNNGHIYMSVPYMKAKGISVLVNKESLTDKTKKSLSL